MSKNDYFDPYAAGTTDKVETNFYFSAGRGGKSFFAEFLRLFVEEHGEDVLLKDVEETVTIFHDWLQKKIN